MFYFWKLYFVTYFTHDPHAHTTHACMHQEGARPPPTPDPDLLWSRAQPHTTQIRKASFIQGQSPITTQVRTESFLLQSREELLDQLGPCIPLNDDSGQGYHILLLSSGQGSKWELAVSVGWVSSELLICQAMNPWRLSLIPLPSRDTVISHSVDNGLGSPVFPNYGKAVTSVTPLSVPWPT